MSRKTILLFTLVLLIHFCILVLCGCRKEEHEAKKNGKQKTFPKNYSTRTFNSDLALRVWIKKTPEVTSILSPKQEIGRTPSVTPLYIPECYIWWVEPLEEDVDWDLLSREIYENDIPGLELKHLDISNLDILNNIKPVRFLYITGDEITDMHLNYLKEISHLQHLVIRKLLTTSTKLEDIHSLISLKIREQTRIPALVQNQESTTPAKNSVPSSFDMVQPKAASSNQTVKIGEDTQDYKGKRLDEYLKNSREIRQWLQTISQWLPEKDTNVKEKTSPGKKKNGTIGMCQTMPYILIREVVMEGVEIPVEPVGKSKVTLTNLSDAPAAAGLPLTIEIQSNVNSSMLQFVGHFENPDLGGEITGKLVNVDLAKLQKDMNDTNRVKFNGGSADVALDGMISRHTIDLGLGVKVKDFQASFAGQKGLFGLDPKISKEAIEVLKDIDTKLRLVGPLAEPHLALDGAGLSGQFKNALFNAGKARLAEEIDKQLGKQLGDKPPEPAKDIINKTDKDVLDGLGDLLGGKKKKEEK
jgi:hypothetical protein